MVDGDLSTYKGIFRIGSDLASEILYFSAQQDFGHWVEDHYLRLVAGEPACCLVVDSAFVGVFEQQRVAEAVANYPRICLCRPNDVFAALSAIDVGQFDFVEKPFTLNSMRLLLEKCFAVYDSRRERLLSMHETNLLFRGLTRREYEVCELVIQGLMNKEISERLDISIKTVKVHRANLMRKISVKSVPELMRAHDAFVLAGDSSSPEAGPRSFVDPGRSQPLLD